ncbi:MAG TPA: hypothetical protein PLB78_19050, partial [Anaerolineae bacterium]|nr:hypothetical protein [Anaerolineae bacterium]
ALLGVVCLLLVASCAPAAATPPPVPPTSAPAPTAEPTPAPQVLRVYNPAGVRGDGVFIDTLLKQTMVKLGRTRPTLAGEFPQTSVEEITIAHDAQAEISELFYKRGWGDGLPIVPPTEERVQAMLQGADLSPDFVIATLDPMGGEATVAKIAVNAVMAGCKPAYLPVLLAAVQAVADPAFDLRGHSTTTNTDIPMLIVSGPIAKELAINGENNALGRGWQANASISRALHLIIQNIGGSWPGVTDMSCLGQPGEFAMCLAENAAANPWTPIHMDLGYPKAANVVTVVAAEGTQPMLGIGQTDEGYLQLIADNLVGQGRAYREVMLVIIAQDTAGMLAEKGWTKQTIAQYITEHATMPFARWKQRFLDTGMGKGVPEWVLKVTDPEAPIPTPFMGQLLVLVSGGAGEKSMVVPCWHASKAVSREIRLPANWPKLVQQAGS